MPFSNREARLLAKLIKVLLGPKPLTRGAKKEAGLKYCRYPGYGYRWFRGRRVPDEYERMVMGKIVDWKQAGYSWYQIAAHLFQLGVRTRNGSEWSPSR